MVSTLGGTCVALDVRVGETSVVTVAVTSANSAGTEVSGIWQAVKVLKRTAAMINVKGLVIELSGEDSFNQLAMMPFR
jgi:hypothetical protein